MKKILLILAGLLTLGLLPGCSVPDDEPLPIVRRTLLILAVAIGLGLSGCRTAVRNVPVETVTESTDTLYHSVWRVDSVVDRDTVRLRGDSVIITQWRWRTRVVHDTLWRVAVDSVYVAESYPVEVAVPVGRDFHLWERALMWIGGLVMAGGVAYGAWWMGRRRI